MERATMNVKETAKELSVSPTAVYTHLVHQPGFPAFRIGGRWVISRNGLMEWIAKQIETPNSERSTL